MLSPEHNVMSDTDSQEQIPELPTLSFEQCCTNEAAEQLKDRADVTDTNDASRKSANLPRELPNVVHVQFKGASNDEPLDPKRQRRTLLSLPFERDLENAVKAVPESEASQPHLRTKNFPDARSRRADDH